MDDLISRQAAIDALNDEYHGMISDESMKIYQIINWLSELPSAQPKKEIAKRVLWTGWKGYMNTRYVPGEKQETIVRWDDE